jgi:hypothetical protein
MRYGYHFTYFMCLIIPWLHHLIMIRFMHALDHVHLEPESEDLAEQPAIEDPASIEQTPDKPWCIPPNDHCQCLVP